VTTTLPDGVQIVNEYTGDYVTRTYYAVDGIAIPHMERRFECDARGNRIKEWDARNNLTQYTYDDRGRLSSSSNPLGEQTLYTYVQDQLTQIEKGRTTLDGEGQLTKFLHDSRDRVVGLQRKNDAGTFVTFQTIALDSEDDEVSVTDAENRTVRTAYDLNGRVASVTDAALHTTQYTYDAVGNRASVLDALGRETRYEYDDLNRLVAVVQLGVSPSARTEYSYDAAGNLLSVRDPEGHLTTYAYDALSRNTRVTQPLGQFVSYAYDNRDRLDFAINARGQKLDYAYEAWGALSTEEHYPTTSATTPVRTISYTHDNDGNVLSVSDSDIQTGTAYGVTYDALSRVYDEGIRYIPGGDRTLSHRYDRYGNRRELTLQDGATTSDIYAYNKLNQLVTATLSGSMITVGYSGSDQRLRIEFPNGVVDQLAHEPNGPVQAIATQGPSGPIASLTYSYDSVSNVDTLIDQYGTHDFGYDGLDRLTQVLRPAASGLLDEGYTYDRVGNRLDPGNAGAYAYDDNNRITVSPRLTYVFDDDGNLQGRSDGASFTHDIRSRLRQFVKAETTASYLYDHAGRRISKTVNGSTTWFLWSGTVLLAEYDAAGSRVKRYAYLDGDYAPSQVQDPNGTYYVHLDHLQTPRFLTNLSAAIVWRARREAFGTTLSESDADGDGIAVTFNVGFPGQYYDSEGELQYNYRRGYDPSTGRYIQSDPIGLDGGLNTYLYADGDPIQKVDPTGESAGAAAGIAAGIGLGIRACMRIPACKKAVLEAIKKCKDVRCKFERHTAHHYFPNFGWCEHYSLTCWIKGQKGPPLFRGQWPFPGRCTNRRLG
jgi:RHS repeat-associated protein